MNPVFLLHYEIHSCVFSLLNKTNPRVKILSVILLFLIIAPVSQAQSPSDDEAFFSHLRPDGPLPEKLLSTRTAVIYSYTLKGPELRQMQTSFKQTGIDAIMYIEMDVFLAGKDVATAYSAYLNKRDISHLLFMTKHDTGYKTYITTYNTKISFIEENQAAWSADDVSLSELLIKIYRASGTLKNENFLIPDFPETELAVNAIVGRRSEFFSLDLKVDQLAVPKFGAAELDKELADIFTSTYALKYKLTEAGVSERDLRKFGNLYVLCFVHARGAVLRKALGYTVKQESAYTSVTYPADQSQLKTIAADTPVYKFYFKHIESGNVFLGTKWDADITWQQALRNHLMAFKAEVK